MSLYDKRFNVHTGYVSNYTDDPAEALRLYNRDPDEPNRWINEGYGEWRDTGQEGVSCVTRRTIGHVLPSTLEYVIQRAEVQKMLEKIR